MIVSLFCALNQGKNNDVLIGLIVSNPFIVADAPNERQAALICDARPRIHVSLFLSGQVGGREIRAQSGGV